MFQIFILNLRPKFHAGLIIKESYKKNKLKLKLKNLKEILMYKLKK